MNSGEDRRIRKTKKLLKNVLIESLQSNEIQKITVKKICEIADINRSTFYLHYNNVSDLWNSIEVEIINSMNDILYSFDAEVILKKPLPLLLELTRYLEEESILSKELFQCRESIVLLDKIKTCFIEYFTNNTKNIIDDDGSKMQMYSVFVISGSVSLFYSWFLGELDVTLNELAISIEKLMTGGVEDYLENILKK